jgi:beta-mannanase
MQAAESAQNVGRKFAIDHRYYPWATAMPDAYDKWTAAHGHIPMISVCSCYWDQANTPVMWADIAHGRYDLYLISIADGFKALKVPTFFGFDAEPETNVVGYSQNPHGTAADYVAAFRHVVDVFRARGATNVAFVWSVTGYAFQSASKESGVAASTYPGDAYVDWLGVDPYNFDHGGAWHSLAYEMGPWYEWARATHPGKPLMLSEWGSVEDPNQPSRKAQWFEQASGDLQSQFSAVRAVVYFDEQKFEQATVHDWRIDTSTVALHAFRTMAHEKWFQP